MENEERKNEWWAYDGRLFNFRPCLFVFLFLCLGIFYGFCIVAYGLSPLWSVLLLPIFAATYLLLRKKSTLIAIWFMAFAFVAGGVSYYVRASEYLASPVLSGKHGVYGEVVSARCYENYTELVLTDIEIDGIAYKGKLVAYMVSPNAQNVKAGDVVFTEGNVSTELTLYGDGSENSFADDIRYGLLSEEDTQVLSTRFRPFAFIRNRLQARIEAGMDEDSGALAFAILTGDSSRIESGLLENVKTGGIAHIFAVSGLHIGTLYAVCTTVSNWVKALKRRKSLRLLMICLVLMGYGAICGFSESVTRAVIGCIVVEISRMIGIKRDSAETLSVAGIFVLAANPVSLFCVGFQLSFLACFGIIFFARPIQVRLERVYERVFLSKRTSSEDEDGIWKGLRKKSFSFLAATVSAQVATAPVLYTVFGYLSVWGLLLNCLLVPCVGIIFPVTLGFGAAACLLPSVCAKIVLFFPNLLWTLLALVFQSLDFSFVFEGGSMAFGMIILYYCALLLLSDKFNLTKKQKAIGFACFAGCFLVGAFLF